MNSGSAQWINEDAEASSAKRTRSASDRPKLAREPPPTFVDVVRKQRNEHLIVEAKA